MLVNAEAVGSAPILGAVGSVVLMVGYFVPEWIRAQVFDKVVSHELLSVIAIRVEFADYEPKL